MSKQTLTGEVSTIDEVDMSDGDEDMADDISSGGDGDRDGRSKGEKIMSGNVSGGDRDAKTLLLGLGRSDSAEREHRER